MAPILAGFRGLGRFSGRDSRGVFWPYAGLVLVVAAAAIFIVLAVQMQALLTDMEAAPVQSSNQAAAALGSDIYARPLGDPAPPPDVSGAILAMGVISSVLFVLLAAAVVRRLHDTGRSGLWALPTPILLTVGLVLMSRVLASFMRPDFDMTLLSILFLNNAAYMLSLGVLIILLILPGRPEANRFGPPSA